MNLVARGLARAGIALVAATGAIVGSLGGDACSNPWCREGVAAACGTYRCEGTYAAALAAPCHGCGLGESVGMGTCDGMRVIVCTNVDVFSAAYYAADGTLTALVGAGNATGLQCLGGPSSFTATDSCLGALTNGPMCTSDLGPDGGAVPDAASD